MNKPITMEHLDAVYHDLISKKQENSKFSMFEEYESKFN